jgi:hypothetical protein
MRLELETKTKQEYNASLRSELVTLLGSTVSPSAISELLLNRFSGKFSKSSNGQWLDSEGTDLKASVDGYLTSDEGKGFVKATVTSTTNKSQSPNPVSDSKDKNAQLVESFLLG